ncbi:hypothetical protein HON36_05785 [Candidatus Parcubacteria bacterium]|jgi:hypothetical protein|nr:hypothetical protein [Candidatus Parcubacteria bacterium]MBT7228679.1 hypothetical protein [Candidatus Parcubacteria bacterium]
MGFEDPQEKITKPEGIGFETPLGKTFQSVDIDFPERDLAIKDAFKEHPELKGVIAKARDFKVESPGAFNGILLGNMGVKSTEGDSLDLTAEKLHYHIYFAAHELRQEQPEKMEERYAALSTCGIVYDKTRKCFYMSVRPSDSQEQASMVDAPGGVLNPDFEDADPFATIKNRFDKKLGLQPANIVSMGLERIFDAHYSLYNVAMYGEVEDKAPTTEEGQFETIPLDKVEEFLLGDRLTSPARATILLTLSQDQFEESGWGKERVKKIMES